MDLTMRSSSKDLNDFKRLVVKMVVKIHYTPLTHQADFHGV